MNNNQLRVLNVIAEDRIGGPQLRILRVARELQKDGIETIVAIPKGQGGFSSMLAEAGVPYREIPNFHCPRGTWNPATHLRWGFHLSGTVRRLVRIIQEDEISLVHQNDAIHIQGAIAGKLAGRAWQSLRPEALSPRRSGRQAGRAPLRIRDGGDDMSRDVGTGP